MRIQAARLVRAAITGGPGHPAHDVGGNRLSDISAAAITFYRRAFGAQELRERFTGPNGELIHAEIQIGNSVVMITEDAGDGPAASPERLGGMVTCVMALYWENVDAAWERPVSAGAR